MSVLHSVVILGGKDPTSELSWRYGVDGVCANDVGVVRFDGNDIEILPIEVSLWETGRDNDNAEVKPAINRLIGGILCGRLRTNEYEFKVIGKLLCW